ncbi:pyridoxal-dependent decarboxylase [Jimgerdemannia flammicorona]|uniref:Pyridoxal-dependent decarboxylase n=1 Tax=Jimgerdemannia flammicorona TaxID=994334 RepID=A0A433Q4L0_9FUNG|nr:pyridoxal-dependent decarboxylase [Jimgerdemannia flammicorona]
MFVTAETVAVEAFDHFPNPAKLIHKVPAPLQDNLDFPSISNLPVREIIRDRLVSIDTEEPEADEENAFFVADLGEIYRQQQRWVRLLPRIEPFFAVKCNPDPIISRLLASLGTGFDCASKAEIQQTLSLGVDPSRVIYANPCKQGSFIRYAAQHGVKKMTFDNLEELQKIKRFFPDAELVLRILADDSKSICKLGLKFGASLDSTEHLLRSAKELDLNVIGVSFHVGSGCFDEQAFSDAVQRARNVFDQAAEIGYEFTLLDVGGGFPGANVQDGITFEKVAAILGPAVDRLFPAHVRVIAEPGRYYVASAFTLATNVIARRTVMRDREGKGGNEGGIAGMPTGDDHLSYMYYINDGMYGSFNCVMFDHQLVHPQVLLKSGVFSYGERFDEPEFGCSVWGPTCDSIDCIVRNANLPQLDVGDWVYFENMGAYTVCAASQFNGFRKSNIVYTNTEFVSEYGA